MLRGRVDERNIRVPAAPAATPAPIDSERAVSPPVGGRQAVRPAALADLAKAPAASASADAAGGLSRRAALPAAPDDPGVVLNKALDSIAAWKAPVAAEQAPQGKVRSPEDEAQFAGPIMAAAWTGLNALATLKMQGRTTDSYADQTEVLLLVVLAKASSVVLDVRDNQLRAQWSQLRAVQADTAETESGPAEDPEPDFDVEQLPRWLVDLKQVRDAQDEIMTRFKSSRASKAVRAGLPPIMPEITLEQSRCRTAMQTVHAIIISDRAGWLLMLAEGKALPDVVTRVRACSHYRRPSTMSAKLMKAMNITSSFSKREKMRRKPFRRRNNRSTSFRRLYISRSYSQGATRVLSGGTTGMKPKSSASCRVSLPS